MCLFIRKPRVTFAIALADTVINVRALYPDTKGFCRAYLTDAQGDISLCVDRALLRSERLLSAQQAQNEGRKPVRCSKRYLETLALCREAASKLIKRDVLLYHGAVMAVNGKAYLFTAKSGTGKTTHCRLWLKNIPDSHILNGDKPLLKFENGRVYACGSPWQGKENYGTNEMLPLEGICILERDGTNHIEEITLRDGFEALMNNCHIPKGNLARAVGLMKQLSAVNIYRLGCNMEDEAALTAYGAMAKNK